ncbi:Gfo/Idh/MocA family protein [Actinoplanes sp. CA-142083]|uniref:Gfo/Idh/MocA family protein n=1 Tax=Actinoplanes sp. CA-142083 TaxID=3239903 RepID=UPI003D8DEBEE
MRPVRWGVLGAANIARLVIGANQESAATSFVAVASRGLAKAREFAASVGLEQAFGSYEELLASDSVDAVYVALPVSLHTEWTVRALRAGKHVLCEKPFATSAEDAARCFDAAAEAGRMVVEGFMWRHHPQTALARRLLAEGAIGRLATIRAALTVNVPPGDIRRSAAMAGGALLDLGCYCVSAARLFGGRPSQVWATRVEDKPEPVDLRTAATMRLPGDVLALFDVGLDLVRRDELELVGTEGSIVVPDPWICRSREVSLRTPSGTQVFPVDEPSLPGFVGNETDAYRIEFDVVSEAIAAGKRIEFGRDDAVEQAAVLAALARSAATGVPVELG